MIDRSPMAATTVRSFPSSFQKRLKKMLKELKSLKKTIRSGEKGQTCPHCGHALWDEDSTSDADTEAQPL
ncbi:MAG: hypothetical protein IPI57_06005 [Candidatus Competibacteraceae bacterium]|nr:hypothetical protein [Candidatus Competibacteraceae bacterium]